MATTNALIKKIEEVKSEGKSYKDANFHKNKKAEIEQVFLPSFEEMTTKFGEVIAAYNNLKTIKEIPVVTIDDELFKESLNAIKEKVINDEYDKLAVKNLKRNLDTEYEFLAGIWKEYIDKKTVARAEMLLTLDRLIADMPEKQILQTQKNIFSTEKIGSAKAIKAIDDYIETYDNLMNKLKLKSNVSDFLKKLTSGEPVSVLDMEDEVFLWLKTSGFAKKILLKVK